MTTPATTKTDLLLLGLLLDRPMHGYELYQQIQAEGIDDWYTVSVAGVYYSLGKLRDQGLIAESRQRGGRSVRKSIYRLTETGRAAFFAAMEAQVGNREKTYLDYDLVIYLLNKLPLRRAIPQLEQRQAFLAEQIQGVQVSLTAEQENGQSSPKLAILDHKRRFLETEQAWLAEVMQSIRAEDELDSDAEGGPRGLMILRGDLHHFHLPDLIRLVVSGQHSGTLTVTDGMLIRTVSFEEGQPVCASSLRRGDPQALSPSPDRVLDELCDLFRSQDGQFTFDQGVGCQDWCTPITCSAEDLILRGSRCVDTWPLIQRLVPSADTIFELGSASRHLDRLALVAVEKRMVAAIDGINDVATIARELDLTLFEASRVLYCLAAAGVVRTADLDKIRLRRVFREIAELMCSSTVTWRTTPDDCTCEIEVNKLCEHLPLRLDKGRIVDRTDPQLEIDEMTETYQHFLRMQFKVVGRHFGLENARQSFERTLRQLAPELQGIARRFGFEHLPRD